MGKKDLIKIETDYNLDFTVLGLIAPHTTVNFIEDGERVKKIRMELPEVVEDVLTCKNPRCITCLLYTSVNKEMGFDINKVNVNGGAIAIGHPIGASGARILTTLLFEMKKRDAKKGLATLCIGGGMGTALIVGRD